jgi:hypothetical protein
MSGLVFYEKSHRYKLDGAWVPGVTTLIGKGLPKPALQYWSARTVAEWVADNTPLTDTLAEMGGRGPAVAFLKGLPWEKRDVAAIRGTDVHDLAEKLVHGEEVDVPEHLAAHVAGYVEWLDRFNPRPLWTERPVASRKWQYAGKFDLIAELLGQTWLLDVKTSRGVYGSTALQLAAYAHCEFLNDRDGNEVPLPSIERYGVLHVTEEGTRLIPVRAGAEDEAWKDYLHVAWVGRAEKRIDDYMAEPIEEAS